MTTELEAELTIYHEAGPRPAALPAVNALFAEARDAGLIVSAVVHAASPEVRRHLAKRRHDLKAALRTMGFTVKALAGGYTFQDDKAAAKIDAIAKALQVLEREGQVLGQLLGSDMAPTI